MTQPGLLVGVWTIDTELETPEQPFISFRQDNTWIASDGCNRVRGTWDLARNGTFRNETGPHILMYCDGAQLPLAVGRASFATVDGDSMVLHSTADSTETRLVRSTDSLVGPQGFPIGYWVETVTPESPFLSISVDGTFTGSDGCNRLNGAWSTDDDDLTTFTGVASTLMACEGVDTWLSGLATGRVVAGVMTVQAEDGTVLGQLESRSRQ